MLKECINSLAASLFLLIACQAIVGKEKGNEIDLKYCERVVEKVFCSYTFISFIMNCVLIATIVLLGAILYKKPNPCSMIHASELNNETQLQESLDEILCDKLLADQIKKREMCKSNE